MGDLGARVGERLAEIVVRATGLSREKSTDHLVRTAMKAQEDFFRLTGSEVARTIGPMWGQVAQHPDAPDWARATAGFVSAGKGQWATLLAGTATGAVLGGGLMDFINNELLPVTGALIATNPHGIFGIADAARMVAHDIIPFDLAAGDARHQGLNEERFRDLVRATQAIVGVPDIFALWNRGVIGDEIAFRLLRRAGHDHDAIEYIRHLRQMDLSPETVAQMWTRSIVDSDQGAAIAARSGLSREDFMRLTELYGQPPAPEILYLAFRRGIIDEARLRRGIVQGPIRNEWFDVIEAVQFHSMTPDQAASAVTQGHMTVGRGQAIAKEYGLDPDDFTTLIETAGLPPGIEFAGEAYNRGLITDDEFGAMFLESRIKNRYLPLLRAMRTRLIPQETARSMLAKGVITPERCAEILHGHGFAPDDIAALIEASSVEKTATARQLTVAQTQALYEEREIDRDQALEMLTALGYDDTEAGFLLDLADIARLRTFRNAIINRVRSGYVAGLIDELEAQTTLDTLGVAPQRITDLLILWGLERSTVTKNLTPAQVVAAAKKQIIDGPAALSRLVGQGYDDADARILLALSGVTA